MEIHERLQLARKKAGYATPVAAATAMGARRATYYQHENGTRGITRHNAERYARFFRVDLAWLLTGKGKPERKEAIPILGYVGAGAEVYPIDDHPKGDGLDYIDVGGLPDDATGLIVKGDSMYPFEDGWIIIYRREQDGVPAHCLSRLCVVKVAEDGPMLLKKLRRGRAPQLYTLESWNAPPREDQRLEWAAPVLNILPR